MFNALIIYDTCRFQDCPFHCQLTNPMHLSVYVLIADTMTFLLFALCLFYYFHKAQSMTNNILKYIIRNCDASLYIYILF